MRADRRSNHPHECNKGTKSTHWTCDFCHESYAVYLWTLISWTDVEHSIPRGQKAPHKRTCKPTPVNKPTSVNKPKSSPKARPSRGLEENAGPADAPHVPQSTHHVDTMAHFAANFVPTQPIYDPYFDIMHEPIPEGVLPFPGGVPDLCDHGILSMSRPSGYPQPIVETSMSSTLISSSRHNVTRMVMPPQDNCQWNITCVPSLAFDTQVDTYYAQDAYEYSLEPTIYHSQMPQQQQPQPQPQISYSSLLTTFDPSQ